MEWSRTLFKLHTSEVIEAIMIVYLFLHWEILKVWLVIIEQTFESLEIMFCIARFFYRMTYI